MIFSVNKIKPIFRTFKIDLHCITTFLTTMHIFLSNDCTVMQKMLMTNLLICLFCITVRNLGKCV